MVKKTAKPKRQTRLQLVKALEKTLGKGARVITYVTGSRSVPGLDFHPGTQIAQDSVRLMYDHLLKMKADVKKESLKVTLFLISNGGDTAVPWRIISMIREVASEFNVLVPYNAMSAATMIAIGADNIYMGPKGELGPIDPTVTRHALLPTNGSNVKVPVSVEDVTSYISFVKDKYGITHEDELVQSLTALNSQISPLLLGLLNRQHSYIRLVGERLLSSRNEKYEEEKINRILASLIEEVTFHGHGISRDEAANALGLHVREHAKQEQLEDGMWNLYCAYEDDFEFNKPIDIQKCLPEGADRGTTDLLPMGAIESRYHSHLYEHQFELNRERHVPSEIKVQFQLPPGVDPAAGNQAALQQVIQLLAQQVTPAVREALAAQSPIIGIGKPKQTKARWKKYR